MTELDGCGSGYRDEPWYEVLIKQSLAEDVGGGDVTTDVAVARNRPARGLIVAREDGVVCGLPLAARVFRSVSRDIAFAPLTHDGETVSRDKPVAMISGPVSPILTAERTALNFLQYLSGIATQTARYVAVIAGSGCRVLDTRKTLPGYRGLAKYAVRCGGGDNHRQGLFDRILLKDNHWAARDGSLAVLVARGRERYPDLMIEVEVDTLAQLREILPLRVDWVLLDNFTLAAVAEAVAIRDQEEATEWRTRLEASGNVTLATIAPLAATGVDAVSVGRLTHSVPALDLGLDLQPDTQGESS